MSQTIHFSPDSLLAEMKTFNAQQTSVILLPKGFSNEFPAVLQASGQVQVFEELHDKDKIVGVRLNKKFFERLAEEFFVSDDYTIKLGLDSLKPKIEALRMQLKSPLKTQNPREWVQRQGELAIRLMEYGGNTNNMELLSEALSRFLDAYETAILNKLDLIDNAKHNLNQFIQDMKVNMNEQEISMITQNNRQAFERYISGNA